MYEIEFFLWKHKNRFCIFVLSALLLRLVPYLFDHDFGETLDLNKAAVRASLELVLLCQDARALKLLSLCITVPVVAFRHSRPRVSHMATHPDVLRAMNLEAGRALVRNIPVPAVVPAKLLVEQACASVGKHAVVRPTSEVSRPRPQDGPVCLTSPSPPPTRHALTRHAHRRSQQFPGRERLNRGLQQRGLHAPGAPTNTLPPKPNQELFEGPSFWLNISQQYFLFLRCLTRFSFLFTKANQTLGSEPWPCSSSTTSW